MTSQCVFKKAACHFVYLRRRPFRSESIRGFVAFLIGRVTRVDHQPEVILNLTGRVVDTQETDARDAQQLVLVIDIAQFVVRHVGIRVPLLPVQAAQQGLCGELAKKETGVK